VSLNSLLVAIINVIRIPIGYILSLIGVILPWQARHTYLKGIAYFIDIMLHSRTFVNFFMEVGFSSDDDQKS